MNFEVIADIFINNWDAFLRGAGVTLLIAIVGTIIGSIIGLIIGVIRTIPTPDSRVKRIFLRIVNWILSFYIEVFRGTPMMVQAMVIFYGLDLAFGIDIDNMTAAYLIVSVNTGAYMAEIVRGGILSIDKGQFEAAHAIGMNHFQTMMNVILPQTIRNILPATGNEFVINIKDTSVLNVISVSELFFASNTIAGANFMFFETFFITSVIYLVLTFTVTRILRLLERKLDGPDNFNLVGNQMQVDLPKFKE